MKQPFDLIKANLSNLTSLWKTAGIPLNAYVAAPAFNYCRVEDSDWPKRLWLKNDVTPEASKMGAGIYLKMGFEEQFLIKNYTIHPAVNINGF